MLAAQYPRDQRNRQPAIQLDQPGLPPRAQLDRLLFAVLEGNQTSETIKRRRLTIMRI
jgi:hypothetical protein